jgi:transcriptional regulator with XRE-family HTH domain
MIKNPINVAFGKAVAQRREELELTQADLAGLVGGMSRASIANIEKGRQNVLLHHVYDLAAALEMPKVGDLMPARPKAALGTLQVNITGGAISPRDLAEVSDLVASALATHTVKAKR